MLDGNLRHVEVEIGLKVEEEEGVVVGKIIVKTKQVVSIEDHALSDDLKKRMFSVFKIRICANVIESSYLCLV